MRIGFAALALSLATGLLGAQPAPLAPPPQDYVAAIGSSPLTAPVNAEFSPGATFTIEAWVYLTAPTVNGGWIAGKCFAAPGADPFLSFSVQVNANQHPEFTYTTGTPGSFRGITSDTMINPRRWTHVAAVMDGAATRLYVNGTLAASGTAAGPPPAPPGVPFSVGWGVLADGSVNYHPFDGYARQLRLWSVARSAAQIAAAASETLPTDRTGLVALWPLDDPPESRTVRDLSGAGRALTSNGLSSIRPVILDLASHYAITRSTRADFASRAIKQGVLLDFDGDGDLDLVAAQQDYTIQEATPRRIRAFRNENGRFTDATDAVLGTVTMIHPRHQVVGDFNGDGRADVLFVGHGYDYPPYPGEPSRLLIATRDGRLIEDPARLPSGIRFTHNVAAADVDRDGDLDIFLCHVATGALGPRLFHNDGRGYFTENTARLPAEILDGVFGTFTASHFVDVNRDGWPDLVLATDDSLVTPPNGVRVGAAIQVLLNRGDGTFRDGSSTSGIVMTPREVWTEWMFPRDFTGDGRPDLILQTSPSSGSRVRFLENLGGDPVRFRDLTDLFGFLTTPALSALLPGDIDRDGRLDLLGVGSSQIDFARGVLPFTEGRLANLSVRTQAGTGDQTLITGFALSGAGTTPLLVRAIGPALGAFGLTGTLADPLVEISLLGGAKLTENNDWGGAAALKNAFASVGAFPLSSDTSQDAALIFSPAAGAYTAKVTGSNGGTGVALVEIYDTGSGNVPKLSNLSARTLVGTGADALFAGFVVNGTMPKRLLIRAVGPTLAAFGVSGTLADPVLTLRPLGSESVVAANDDWGGSAAFKAAFASVGAFGFSSDTSRDAALVLDLPPGAYTATVSGQGDATGVALVEVYELP